MTTTERIGEGIGNVLNGLRLDPSPVAIRNRKRPVLQDRDGTLPLLFVCVGNEEEMECLGVGMVEGRMTWLVKRPVTIAMAFAKLGKDGDDTGMRNWRDAIWSACTLTTMQRMIPELNDVNPRGRPIFDHAAFTNTQVDWSMIDLTIETLESRSM